MNDMMMVARGSISIKLRSSSTTTEANRVTLVCLVPVVASTEKAHIASQLKSCADRTVITVAPHVMVAAVPQHNISVVLQGNCQRPEAQQQAYCMLYHNSKHTAAALPIL